MIAGGVSARSTQIPTNAVRTVCVYCLHERHKHRTYVEFYTKSDAQVEDVIAGAVSTRGRQETRASVI